VSGRADAVVLFGASGDLARRMLFPALYELARAGHLGVPVVGVASSNWSDDDLRTHARDAIAQSAAGKVDDGTLDDLTRSLRYVGGDYRQPTTFDRLREVVGDTAHPLIYLAIPPSMFETVVAGLARVGLNEGGRVVVEKPFGRDLVSARELNACLLDAFDEEAVFRIDHPTSRGSFGISSCCCSRRSSVDGMRRISSRVARSHTIASDSSSIARAGTRMGWVCQRWRTSTTSPVRRPVARSICVPRR
jgi:glucose-6-phosphate 1-dehydrogenase